MSAHDKGPWIFEYGRLKSAEGNQVVMSEGPAFGSASVWPKAKANSRLVLTSPELLEALDRLRQQCDRLRLPGQQITDAEKNADAVIAKAKGETA